ncbi:hypothetical protein GA0115261_112531, partial [Streptomyces sp. OspMP-M43]
MRMPPTRSDVMTVHPTHSTARRVSRRRRVALCAASLLCCSAILTALPGGASAAPAAGPQAAGPGTRAVAFEDQFDGPAGAGVDGAKWRIETGDNVNNHERQY